MRKKTILVFCEGVTEKNYFDTIKKEGFLSDNVNLIAKHPNCTPEKMLTHVPQALRMDGQLAKSKVKPENVWLVFDRDKWPEIPKVFADIEKAGYNYVFSNCCFEAWLALHYHPKPAYAADSDEAVAELNRLIENENKKRKKEGRPLLETYSKPGGPAFFMDLYGLYAEALKNLNKAGEIFNEDPAYDKRATWERNPFVLNIDELLEKLIDKEKHDKRLENRGI